MKLLKKAHGNHAPFCPIGGSKAKDSCLHASNCCCEGGERVDWEYALQKIDGLNAEIRYWLGRMAVSV